MDDKKRIGKIQTVLGLIDPKDLGVTLMHEHILADLSKDFVDPEEARDRAFAHQPVTLENIEWIRTHFGGNTDNLRLTDEDTAIREANLYKVAGGNTIVEQSVVGLCRDPNGLARVSRATGLNIVMTSGYYIASTHPEELLEMSAEEMADIITKEILSGVGDTGIKAGIIGEIGCSPELHENERKVLRAGAIAQKRTGAALSIHPSFGDEALFEIIDIVEKAGADLSRVIICHNDLFGTPMATQKKMLEVGCYIEYDTFGFLLYPHFVGDYFVPCYSDSERVDRIIDLIETGYLHNILISHDICFKIHLTSYGGYGYAHILCNTVPLMKGRGISEEQIHTILIDNPQKVLTLSV